jgi:transposase
MFVCKKKNPSGVVSVQVIDKSNGKYKVVKTVGNSSDACEIEKLYSEGKKWIDVRYGNRDMFAVQAQEQEERQVMDYLLSNVENILLNGTQLVLNRIFRIVGFDLIEDEIFKQLVVSRLCQPQSKVATVDYLKSHFDEDVELYRIYRYLDKLQSSQKDKVQQISVEHTRRIPGGKTGLVFYDVTTLYFETDYGDELRKTGFSKDGKHAQPQIVLGLLVSAGGYPLAYRIHEGNKYEGHTMLPVVEDFVKKFELKEFAVIADSGLMNRKNIADLESKNYKYILGARIKTESKEIKSWILSLEKTEGCSYELGKLPKSRLIVSYSESRAKKDVHNRKKGIQRLEKEYRTARLTKDKVYKRGYNKFLEISNEIKVNINYDKIKEEEHWDG